MASTQRSHRLSSPCGRQIALLVVLLLLAVGAALAPTLGAGFVYDDRADVLDNPAASPDGFLPALGRTNRPLLKATYAVQRATTGSVAGPFHAVNLALHLACTMAAFALARRFAEAAEAPRATLVGAAAAAFWALHPAVVEAVAPISGRSVLLSTLLLLGALLLVTGVRPPGRRLATCAAVLACAAPLARETALVLPALGLAWQATLGASETRAAAFRRQVPLFAGTLLALGALALSARHRELLAYSFAVRPPLESLRGNLYALFEIVRLWIEPGRISIDPAPAADLAWRAPATLLRLALLAAVAVFALASRRRWPLAALACGWALLALAPANSLVWRLDPVSARPLYLATLAPLAALAALAATLASRLARHLPPAAGVLRASLIAACALALVLPAGALARRSHQRARLYSDPIALWSDAAEKAPERARPWQNLGVELMLADRLVPAERALERSLELDPAASSARCALHALRIRQRANQLSQRSLVP